MTRSRMFAAWVIAAGVLVGAACSASDGAPAEPAAAPERPDAEAPTPSPPPGAGSSVAEAITPLPPAAPVPTVVDQPPPTALAIDSLEVGAAPVVPVGVEDNGDMEVPEADQVGWYRFGARPGDEGAAVLAAHVAYDGVDGVFRNLDDLTAGAEVQVQFADGSEQAFAVTEVARYDKTELPDDVWARAGPSQLVLITCGGEFDASEDSYEDNVVAYATPT